MALLTQSWICDCAFILLCGFVGIYLYATRNFKYWKKRGVKEIVPVPFFGNFASCLFTRKSHDQVLQEFYETGKGKPYIGYYILDKPYLLLRDPLLIKQILIKDFNYFSNRIGKSFKLDIIGNMNLFFMKNPDWKYIRQKLTPIFTSGKLKKMFELMLEIDQDFEIYLESLQLEGKGRSIEVKEICAKFTTDLIGITAYGMRFNCLGNPRSFIRKLGKDIFSKTYKRFIEFTSTFFMPVLVDIFGFKIFGDNGTKFMRDIFWEAIDERIKSNTKRGDLIDLLIDLKKDHQENGIKKFDDDVLVANAAVFFTGGFETSSTTMSFTLYELAKHPEIQERLRDEILDVLKKNNGKITYDMIMSSFPYLDMTISEALRMYPILPFLDRYADTDYQVPDGKLTIEAGIPVIIPMHSIHMDENYFPNAYVFDPERFSNENKRNIKSNTYFPFGEGPRNCIGMRLGYLQVKLGLTHLLSKFEFSPCNETPDQMEFDTLTLFLSCPNDIVLNVRKISVDK